WRSQDWTAGSRRSARRWHFLFRSTKTREEQSFMRLAFITAAPGPLGLIISAQTWALGFDLICRLVRCGSIMDTRYSATDIMDEVISTSTSAINFERIYMVAV